MMGWMKISEAPAPSRNGSPATVDQILIHGDEQKSSLGVFFFKRTFNSITSSIRFLKALSVPKP